MLGKLLKYDLKFVFKNLNVFYILLFISTIIGRLFNGIENSTIMHIISQIFMGISIAMIFNILINGAIRIWVRMTENVYKDQSYLTHTLPVTKKDIFLSKILCSLIVILVSFIVILLGVAIWFWKDTTIEAIKSFFNMGFESKSTILLFVLTCYLEFFFLIVVGLLGIVLGHKFNNRKIILSIIFSILIYGAFNLLSLGLLGAGTLFFPGLKELFISNVLPTTNQIHGMLEFAVGLYLVYSCICSLVSINLFNKGVNVE